MTLERAFLNIMIMLELQCSEFYEGMYMSGIIWSLINIKAA